MRVALLLFLCYSVVGPISGQIYSMDYEYNPGEIMALTSPSIDYIIQYSEYRGLECIPDFLYRKQNNSDPHFGKLDLDRVVDLNNYSQDWRVTQVVGLGFASGFGCENYDKKIKIFEINKTSILREQELKYSEEVFDLFSDDHSYANNNSVLLEPGKFLHLVNKEFLVSESDTIYKIDLGISDPIYLDAEGDSIYVLTNSGCFLVHRRDLALDSMLIGNFQWVSNVCKKGIVYSFNDSIFRYDLEFDTSAFLLKDTFGCENAKYAVSDFSVHIGHLVLWNDTIQYQLQEILHQRYLIIEPIPGIVAFNDIFIDHFGFWRVGSVNDFGVYAYTISSGIINGGLSYATNNDNHHLRIREIDNFNSNCDFAYEINLYTYFNFRFGGELIENLHLKSEALEYLCVNDCEPSFYTSSTLRFNSDNIVEAQFFDTIYTTRQLSTQDTFSYCLALSEMNADRMNSAYSKCYRFKIGTTTDVAPISQIDEIDLFPNPASTYFFIDSYDQVQVKIKDINGNIVKRLLAGSIENKVDISNLPSGVYLVELSHGNDTVVKRIVKQ